MSNFKADRGTNTRKSFISRALALSTMIPLGSSPAIHVVLAPGPHLPTYQTHVIQ